VKLIGAGLPRTGTLSQKLALEMVGLGPCYHMVNVLADLGQAELWLRALDGDTQWSEIFEGFQSTVDWPGGYFYKELIEVYPDAKVLLSEREPEAWERSMRETVWGVRHGESLMRFLSSAQGQIYEPWAAYLRMIDGMLWNGHGTFASGHMEPGQLIEGMLRHHEEVKRTVPADRLLVWSFTDGWEPLCQFLGVAVPGAPFPHVNDSHEFVDRVIEGSLLRLNEWHSAKTAESSASVTR
jgi:Sulfotransferase domain